MGYFALEHPNPRAKANPDGRYWGYATRKGGRVSGVIVVHSAEVAPDYVDEDRGAEATASYFTHSDRPASYHLIVDSDSIVRFLPLSHTAFHDATGTNHHSIGVSMGTQAHTWGTRPDHDDRMVRNAARAIAEALRYAAGQHDDPADWARWITPAQARRQEPGLVEHGEMDPTRRSDPWTKHRLRPELRDRLLRYVREELTTDTPKEWDEMATRDEIAQVVTEGAALAVMAITGDQFDPATIRTADVFNLRDLSAELRAGIVAVGVQVIQQVGHQQGVAVDETKIAQAVTDELARRLGS